MTSRDHTRDIVVSLPDFRALSKLAHGYRMHPDVAEVEPLAELANLLFKFLSAVTSVSFPN